MLNYNYNTEKIWNYSKRKRGSYKAALLFWFHEQLYWNSSKDKNIEEKKGKIHWKQYRRGKGRRKKNRYFFSCPATQRKGVGGKGLATKKYRFRSTKK